MNINKCVACAFAHEQFRPLNLKPLFENHASTIASRFLLSWLVAAASSTCGKMSHMHPIIIEKEVTPKFLKINLVLHVNVLHDIL